MKNRLKLRKCKIYLMFVSLLWLQIPFTAHGQECLKPMEISTIEIPIRASLQSMVNDIEQKVPMGEDWTGAKTTTGQECILGVCGDAGYTWRWRRDPFGVQLNGDTLSVTLRFFYGAEGFVCVPFFPGRCSWKSVAGCGMGGEAMKRVEARITTRIVWKSNGDYGFEPTITVSEPDADPCGLTFLDINATPVVKLAARLALDRIRDRLDSHIRSINFEPSVQKAWAQLQDPIGIGAGTTDWIIISPLGVSADPFIGSNLNVDTKIRLSALTQVVRNGRPNRELHPYAPLPRLGTAMPGSGIKVYVSSNLSFTEASSKLRPKLVNRQFMTPAGSLRISDAWMSGRAKSASAHIRIEGDLQGMIAATGTITFDQPTQTMKITGLTFAGKADNEATQALFDQILQDPQLTSLIQESLVWPLGTDITNAQTQINTALNRPVGTNISATATLTGIQNVEAFAVPKIAVFDTATESANPEGTFIIMMSANGTASVLVH